MEDYSVLLKDQIDRKHDRAEENDKRNKELTGMCYVKRSMPRYLRRVFDSNCEDKIKATIQRAMEKDDFTKQEIAEAVKEYRLSKIESTR